MWDCIDGKKSFMGGKDDYALAVQAAKACGCFTADEDEEREADEKTSCYNCRYRRWTRAGFDCMRTAL